MGISFTINSSISTYRCSILPSENCDGAPELTSELVGEAFGLTAGALLLLMWLSGTVGRFTTSFVSGRSMGEGPGDGAGVVLMAGESVGESVGERAGEIAGEIAGESEGVDELGVDVCSSKSTCESNGGGVVAGGKETRVVVASCNLL